MLVGAGSLKKKRDDGPRARLGPRTTRPPRACLHPDLTRPSPPAATLASGPPRSHHRRAFFFQAEDGIRDGTVTGVQTCALPIFCITALGAIAIIIGALVPAVMP